MTKVLTSCQQCPKAPTTIILLWNMLVGCVFSAVVLIPLQQYLRARWFQVSFPLAVYVFVGTVQMMYPIGGLIADLCFGRCKVIAFSILLIYCGFLCGILDGVLYLVINNEIVGLVMAILAGIIFTVGFSGYKSNSVQFSLDQLMDAPSERMSSFLHWFVWVEHVGDITARLLVTSDICNPTVRHKIVTASVAACLTFGTALVCLTYFIRDSFYKERISSNPYRNVWKVLKFALRHSKPLGHRSAFTYSDDVKPSKMDFAKRIYGGPFETEIVEDVKTFCRIVLLLAAITLVYWLEVPTLYLFPLFGLHLSNTDILLGDSCSYKWMIFESGNLSSIISVLAIPIYLLLTYPCMKKWVPRMIVRLGIGIVLMVASITSMLIFQAVANHNAFQIYQTNYSTCFFLDKHSSFPLEFPTQALVVTNLLYGVASPLISITVLEFISAQSPHTMKGVLLGVYYAFRGLFITLGSVATFPFVQERLWGEHDGMFSCGFYYYLSNSVFGVFGLVVFTLAARCYRNRVRDDPPYRHQYAEDYYSCHQPTRSLVDGNDMDSSYGTIN